MVKNEHQIQIASSPENIAELETFIDQLRESENIGDEMYGNVIISLTEAVNNAIIHGNRSNPSKNVTLTYKKDGTKLCFTVHDEGPGFDHASLPDPTDPENLEKLTGRGVFLMEQLSDMLIFSNGGNTVEMQFKL